MAKAKKKSAVKSKTTVSDQEQIENDMLIAANEADKKKYSQAWERGISFPTSKHIEEKIK